MADAKPRSALLRLESLHELLAEKLDNEAAILDVLLGGFAKGQPHPELWDQLHRSAARDDRIAELAFAYERLPQDRRIKMLNAAAQADVLMHAARFFSDVFGDPDGSENYLERALHLVPGHPEAFDRFVKLLERRGETLRLSDLYAAAASGRADRGEQLDLLKRAAALLSANKAQDEKAVRLLQQVLKLDPGDRETRAALESRLVAAGRHSDVAKLLEQALIAEPAPDGEEELAIRSRLLDLYAGKLSEIERATPHVEEVLARDPTHERARKVAEQLLSHRAVVPRAAAALEGVFERLGDAPEAARMLALQVDHLRGPKRLEAQKRLAILRFERLGDVAGARPMLEQIVAADPADDDIRQRYRTTAAAEGKLEQATRILTRAASGAKDPALKARIGAEVGAMYLDLDDDKRARAMFQQVLESGGDDEATLKSARALARLTAESKEYRILASVLERLHQLEPEVSARTASAERLAKLCEEELDDTAGAARAWQSLLGTQLDADAQAALERLYTQRGAWTELVELLELRAEGSGDPAAIRAIAMRAVEVRVAKTTDRAATIAALERVRDRFGPARDLMVHLLPLYEQERRWGDLAGALAAEVELAPPEERVGLWIRLAQIRQSRLEDPRGALEAYRVVLSLDVTDRTSRLALEKLLGAGEHRLGAAEILEAVYRAEPSATGLVRVLEVRAELATEPEARLAALAEAAELAELDLRDPARAFALTGRGLCEAVEGAPDDVGAWLDRIDAIAPTGGDPDKRAQVMTTALGARAVDSPLRLDLARRAGEALVQCGDVAAALEIYRRALAYEPSSTELLSRVDALLKEQGSPGERLQLYRAALEQPCEPARRRELLHAIGGIQRRDLRDFAAAIATYRAALADDPDDRAAYGALLDAHGEAGAWDELYDELSRGMERASGDEKISLELRMADVSVSARQPARAADHYRRLLASDKALPDEVLDRVLELSEALQDDDLARLALLRRVDTATDATEEAIWLERLGTVYAVRLDQPEPAIEAWMRGAALAEGAAADPDRATRLYERVLALAASEAVGRQAALRLVDIYRRAENWPRLVSAYQSLLRSAPSDEEAASLALALEEPAVRAGQSDVFILEIDRILARVTAGRAALWAAKARVLGDLPMRRLEAAATYRLMVQAMDAEAAAAASYQAFLDRHPDVVELVDEQRWLWSFRAERAEDADRVRILLGWARAEEERLGDPARAAAVYDRVLEVDPEQDEALAARSRLLLLLGDVDGAVGALSARRDKSEGEARAALELELAELYIDKLGRPVDALDVVEALLDRAPADPAALRIVERALGHADARVRAAQLVERALEAVDDRELAGALLDVLLDTPADVPELRAARRRWFESALGHRKEDPAAAFAVALRAVRELPEEEVLWERAERLGRELSKPDLVADAYRKLLEEQAPDRAPDDDDLEPVPLAPGVVRLSPDVLEVVGRRGVEYHEEWFDDPEVVAQMLRRILEVAPRATWAFERLKLAYNAAERWDDLFFLYDRVLASVTDPDARQELLEDAALTAKDFAGDADRAIDYFAALLVLRPGDTRVAASLERLYERLGRHGPLIELLMLSLPSADAQTAKVLRLRIATLYMEGLGEPHLAFESVERVLAEDPESTAAFDLLERLVVMPEPLPSEEPRSDRPSYLPSGASSATPRRSSQPPPSRRPRKVSVRHRAATLLKDRYKSQDRSADVVRMLEVELEGVGGQKERTRRLREIVTLKRDVLGDEAGAFDSLAQLVALVPASVEPRRELERLAESTTKWSAYAETLAAIADGVPDRALCRQLLVEAGAVYRERLKDAAMAIELGRRVLDLSDGDAKTDLAIARELDLLLSDAGRLAERCDVLERLAELESDPAERRRAWGEVARIAMVALEDHDRAVRAERRRLEDDPADMDALDGLVRALRESRRHAELVEALGKRALASQDASARRRDHGDIAKLLSNELGRPDEAIDAWMRIRETHGPDDESADVLGTLLFERGRHEELCKTLAEEAVRADTRERSAELWARLGDTHVGGTGMVDKAVGAYQTALDRDVENERARRGLEGLLRELVDGPPSELFGSVVSILTEAYATQPSGAGDGDWAATIDLCPARLRAAGTDADRVAILVDTARLLEERREDPQGAFDCTWRALVLAPRSPEVAEQVVRRAGLAERWDHVASEIREVLSGEGDDPAVARALWSSLAGWYREVRQDPVQAEASLTQALAAVPGDVEVLAGLAELQRRSKGRPLVETLLRLAEATGDDLALYREAVEIAVDHVRDRGLAEPLAHRLVRTAVARWEPDPAEPGISDETLPGPQSTARWAIDVLVRLARDAGDEAGVKAAYLEGAKLPFEPAVQREMLLSAAELATGEEAIELFSELFDREPTDVRVAGRLEALYRAAGRRDDLLALRRRQIEAADTPAARAALRLHVAALHMEAEAWDRAIEVLRDNLAEIPTDESTVMRLAELYAANDRNAELGDLWEGQSNLRGESDPAAAAQFSERAAELAEEKLDDPRRAIAAYERAVDLADSTRSMDALARLHTARGDHPAAAAVLERLVERVRDDALAEQTARLCDAYLMSGREAKARDKLEALLPRVQNPAPLRARLAGLYRDAEAWGPLATLLAAEAADAPDRATRLARLREAADLHLSQLQDPSAALPLLEQAADLDPENLAVRLLGCEAMRLAGKSDEATAVLRGIVADYGGRRPKERALVHHELAKVALAAGDRARALGELDVAVKIDPGHPDVLHAIATLALEEGQLARAQRMFRALLLVLRSHRTAVDERRGRPRISRAEILLELADISERHGEPHRGSEFMESAFEVAAESPFERHRFLEALRRRAKYDVLARAIEHALSSEPPDAADLLFELAGLYEGSLQRKQDALEARLRAVALAPTSKEQHDAALALARELGQTARYMQAVDALVEAAARSGGTDVAVELDLILGHTLVQEGDDERAAEAFRRAESALSGRERGRPDRLLRVWSALERIHGRTGDVDAQVTVLEKLAETTSSLAGSSPAEKAEPFYRLAFLKLGRRADREDACSLLERAVEMDDDPANVLSCLRRAIDDVPDEERLLRLFEGSCRRQNDDPGLVDALQRIALVEGIESPAWREATDVALRVAADASASDVALRVAADASASEPPAPAPEGSAGDATLIETVKDVSLPESILRRYLGEVTKEGGVEGPGAAWALVRLSELRETGGDIAEAAELRERAGRVAPPDEERPLLLSAARLLAGPLGRGEDAARIYEELREREPAARDLWEPLADVYRGLGDHERLGRLIEETVPMIEDLSERSNLRLERATIVLASDAEAASILLFEILEEDSGHEEATRLLSELLEKAGRIDDLIALLNQQLDAAKDVEDKAKIVAVSLRLGGLLEERGQHDDALDIYHAASDWDADDPSVLRAVVRLSIQRGDSLDIGDALDKLLSVERGPEAVNVARQLYDIKSAHGDVAAAEAALDIGYRAHPHDEDLERELCARYTEREQWDRLAEVMATSAAARPDGAKKVEGLRAAAELLRSRAGDHSGAAAMLERALAFEPLNRELLFALIEALSETGEFGRAHAALSRAIETLGEREDGWLYRSRASMQEALGRPDEALRDLQRAYVVSGGDYAGELAGMLEDSLRQAAGSLDERRVRSVSLELAEVLARAKEIDRARYYLGELSRRDPKDRDVLRAVADLEEQQGNWDAVSAAYRRLVSIEEGEGLVDAALRLADACERGSRSADARGGLERALRANPQNGELRSRLRAVYLSTAAYRELAELVMEEAQTAPDVQGRFQMLIEAGRLLLLADDETARAIVVLEEAAGLEPEDQSCTLRLAEAYGAAGRRAEAMDLLSETIARQKGRRGPKLAEAYHTLYRLEQREGNLSESLAALSRAFESDPHNATIALELGSFAVDLDDRETAQRAYRAVTMMKNGPPGTSEGASAEAKAVAYYQLGRLATAQGDMRRARLMLEKSVSEDPNLEVAQTLLNELRAG